jgi:hypothetical protein
VELKKGMTRGSTLLLTPWPGKHESRERVEALLPTCGSPCDSTIIIYELRS